MCDDLTPEVLSPENNLVIEAMLDVEAKRRGYIDWIDAYHSISEDEKMDSDPRKQRWHLLVFPTAGGCMIQSEDDTVICRGDSRKELLFEQTYRDHNTVLDMTDGS